MKYGHCYVVQRLAVDCYWTTVILNCIAVHHHILNNLKELIWECTYPFRILRSYSTASSADWLCHGHVTHHVTQAGEELVVNSCLTSLCRAGFIRWMLMAFLIFLLNHDSVVVESLCLRRQCYMANKFGRNTMFLERYSRAAKVQFFYLSPFDI